jgi:hypothetical protein
MGADAVARHTAGSVGGVDGKSRNRAMSVPKRSALLILVAVAGAALTVITPTPAAALCIPPVDVTSATVEATVAHRYAWFLIESLSRARLAWEEADRGAESHNAVVRLASLKLAIEDLECAASLVQIFQGTPRGSDEFTTEGVQVSAEAATWAYATFASSFKRWATALARGEGLPLDEAADVKVQNEKAAELLIHAVTPAWFALLKPPPDRTKPADRLSITRAQRTALREGLRRRFPTAGTQAVEEGAHSPDLAAKLLDKGLSNPRYKAADDL